MIINLPQGEVTLEKKGDAVVFTTSNPAFIQWIDDHSGEIRMVSTELTGKIRDYYRQRNLKWPTVEQALMFVQTELGEIYEILLSRELGWVRNHPQDKPVYSIEGFNEELGDAIMMLIVAGMIAGGDPIKSLLNKLERKESNV